jgi:hypothetical protein
VTATSGAGNKSSVDEPLERAASLVLLARRTDVTAALALGGLL